LLSSFYNEFNILPLEWEDGGPACLAKFLRAAANDRPPGDGGGGAWSQRFGIKVRFEPELVGWGLTKPKITYTYQQSLH